jgi:hypothetical protein
VGQFADGVVIMCSADELRSTAWLEEILPEPGPRTKIDCSRTASACLSDQVRRGASMASLHEAEGSDAFLSRYGIYATYTVTWLSR